MHQVAWSWALSFQIMERHGGRPLETAVVKIIVVLKKIPVSAGSRAFCTKKILSEDSISHLKNTIHTIALPLEIHPYLYLFLIAKNNVILLLPL